MVDDIDAENSWDEEGEADEESADEEEEVIVPPPPPLSSFEISDDEQRVQALCAFHQHGLGHLIPFIQQFWDALNEPKADRVAQFAQIIGVHATGKMALRKVLMAFYEEATDARFEAIDARGPVPEIEHFSDISAWYDAAKLYLGLADMAILKVAKKYSSILVGENPVLEPGGDASKIIQGPWKPIVIEDEEEE